MSTPDSSEECSLRGVTLLLVNSLTRGSHCTLDSRPCKVVEISTALMGKHGHTKARIVAQDIFTGKRKEVVLPYSESIPTPVVTRTEYTLVDITQDSTLSLMSEAGELRHDLDLPEDKELASCLRKAFAAGKDVQVVVAEAMGIEGVVEMKVAQRD